MRIEIQGNPKFIYAISDGFQLLEHVLAIYEWLGGEIHVTKRKPETATCLEKFGYNYVIDTLEDLKSLNAVGTYFILPSGSHGYSELGKFRTFATSHGVSEKGFQHTGKLRNKNEGKMPLQFSRYIRGTYEYSLDYHRNFLQLDADKKTVLYAPTQGTFSSLDFSIVEEMVKLKNSGEYNVVVKPHALCWSLNKPEIEELSKHFPVDIELHNIAPFLDLMDIYIGDISAATSAAMFYPEKPLVLLKDKNYDYRASPLVMKEDTIDIIHRGEYEGLRNRIKFFLSNSDQKKLKKIQYFKTWYGSIDGTEGFQYAIYILNKAGISYKFLEV